MDMDANDSKTMLRFRESFRGYNKDDVNAYIEQANMRFSRKESELRAQLAEVCRRNSSESDPKTAEKEAALGAMRSKLEAAETENARLRSELETLKQNAVSDSEREEKSRLYDSMSSQVGNILIVANSNADKIIADAQGEAARIRAEAELEAEKIRLTAEERMNAMLLKMDEKLRAVSDSYLSGCSLLIAEAQSKFSDITETMKKRSDQLRIDADQVGRDIERQIAEGYCRPEAANEG